MFTLARVVSLVVLLRPLFFRVVAICADGKVTTEELKELIDHVFDDGEVITFWGKK